MNHAHQPFSFADRRTLGDRPLEELPAEFDAELRSIDTLLAQHASRTSVPRQLSDTVYDITVGLLVKREQAVPEFVIGRRWIDRTMWGRLAMAAALGLAFVVALACMRVPIEAHQRMASAELPASAGLVLLESSTSATGASADYLLETQDLTTRDVDAAVHRVISELEI